MTRNFVVQCLKMGMDVRPRGRKDALMLAGPKADKLRLLAVELEWDLNFLVSFHAGRRSGRCADDVEIDHFRPSRHHEWKSWGQPCLGTDVADESFQLRVGPHDI